jgi:hypothetical protein
MNDTELAERLARAGAAYQRTPLDVPSLDTMLPASAGRPRRTGRWLAVAATIVAVAGIAVAVPLALSSGRSHEQQTVGAPSPSPVITRDGTVLRLVGSEEWTAPILDERDRALVHVFAAVTGGTAEWGQYCVATPVAVIVAQTGAAVTVRVDRYAEPVGQRACTDIGRSPTRLAVHLSAPLDGRDLVDATTGQAVAVLDAATILRPGYVPDGYTGGEVGWDQKSGHAQRVYQGPGGEVIIMQGDASVNRPLPTVVAHPTVRGHEATVSYHRGFEQDILVSWNEDATHAVSVYQVSNYDQAHPPLAIEDLVRIANSLG